MHCSATCFYLPIVCLGDHLVTSNVGGGAGKEKPHPADAGELVPPPSRPHAVATERRACSVTQQFPGFVSLTNIRACAKKVMFKYFLTMLLH